MKTKERYFKVTYRVYLASRRDMWRQETLFVIALIRQQAINKVKNIEPLAEQFEYEEVIV